MDMMKMPGLKPEEKQMIRKQSVQDIASAEYPLAAGNDRKCCPATGKNGSILAWSFCHQNRQYFI